MEYCTGTLSDKAAVRFRPLKRADLPLLLKWLRDPAVLEFYEGRDRKFTREQLLAEYFSKDDIRRNLIELGGSPAGYLQYYPEPHEPGRFGVDLFIGEPGLWGKGWGRAILDRLVGELSESGGITSLQLDPRVENLRAIRCYSAAGFRRERLLEHHEFHEGAWHDCLLMVRRFPEFSENKRPGT